MYFPGFWALHGCFFTLDFGQKKPIFVCSIQCTFTKSLLFESIERAVHSSYNTSKHHLFHYLVVNILSIYAREFVIWKRNIKHF